MATLINTTKRPLGVYLADGTSVVVPPKKSIPVDDHDMKVIRKNHTAKAWLAAGSLKADDTPEPEASPIEAEPNEPAAPPAAVAASDEQGADETDKAELRHLGGGRYGVFVGDEKLSDEPLSKEDAQAMAEEYGAGN